MCSLGSKGICDGFGSILGASRALGSLHTQVYLTAEERYGPVNIIAWWEKDDDGKEVLRGVMTNLPATAWTRRRGTRWMWIETVFRDWQSGGFRMDRSRIMDRVGSSPSNRLQRKAVY